MKNLQEFSDEVAPTPKVQHPQGWEPSIQWNGSTGTISTGPVAVEPDPAIWNTLIKDWGLDPELTEVVDGTVQVRGWDANVGGGQIVRLKYYRATIRKLQRQNGADLEDLKKLVRKRRPLAKVEVDESPERALVVPLSDWQLGKGEGGGTPAATERILHAADAVRVHLAGLKKLGRAPQVIYLVGMGDLLEGCSGFYQMQEYQIDLTRREQMALGRELLMNYVETLLPLGIPLILAAVPGNHGENRKTGKAFTTWSDNDDLAIFDGVREILAHNPERYGNVFVPQRVIADDLTTTLSVGGVNVGFAHGHQMRSGAGGAQAKIEKWWKDQALGRRPVADAQILFTGHLHHFVVSEATGRTFFQCPTMDGGSFWYAATSGASAPAGQLVVSVGQAYGERCWSDLVIL